MKKRLIAYTIILLLLVSMLSGLIISVGAATGSSVTYAKDMTANSSKGTYYVADAKDLAQIATLVNGGHPLKEFTFLQTQDIDLSGVTYVPIGVYDATVSEYENYGFQGTYDGQKYVFKNFNYSDKTRNGAGIFGYAYNATLKNIGVESGSVTAANRAGGMAGYADGCKIINCYNKADITIVDGTDGVGGIVGVARSSAKIYGCYNAGTVTCVTAGAGGIAGWGGKGDNIMLIGCYSAGTLAHSGTLSTASYVLDVISRNTNRTYGDFSSCYYLAGIYGDLTDDYNLHYATKLEQEDALKMAYVLNHATGANTNAFTVNSGGELAFSADKGGVTDLRIKAVRDGVLLSDTGLQRETVGGYTVPELYDSYTVLSAKAGEETYAVGDFIPSGTAGSLTVELMLEGDYPSVTAYAENTDATVFTVGTAEELAALAELVDAGNSFADKTVYVTADLDFADYPVWNGIGICKGTGGGTVTAGAMPFSGTFDGQYHHFKNVNFRTDTRYGGIFDFAQNAVIRNMILDEGTIHCTGVYGRMAGAVVGAIANTKVQNIENHVSVYADQEDAKADNLGLVAMSVDGSVISNCINYGEVGYEGKANVQQNGGFVGYGYGETTVQNCVAVGAVSGSESNPIARGCTVTKSYYLPHGETAGTMTYETLLRGEAALLMNELSGTALWSKAEYGPTLDPDHPVQKITYTLFETDNLLSGTVTEYQNADQSAALPAYTGFTLLNGSKKLWPLADQYVVPWEEAGMHLYYSHKAYEITYVTNGGTFLSDPETVAIGGTSQPLPTALDIERSGYFFAGWYPNEALSGTAVTDTPVDEYRDVIYYAAWKAVTKISTPAQLAAMKVNGNYVLTADIDMSGTAFSPIGTYEKPFTGTFDGDGHTISGLTIDSTENYQGLFGVNEGIIRNVVLDDDCVISGNAYVGGIAGENFGTISGCISRATVAGATDLKSLSFTLLVQNMRVANPIPEARQEAMKERMDTCSADLMVLQEANAPWIEFLNTNYVSTGEYEMVYKYRAESETEAVPILYKPDKFKLLESGYYWLSETPDVESKPEDAKHYRICTWVALEDLTKGRTVLAFSVHLDNSTNEVRTINAQALKDGFDEIRAKYASDDPVCIIAGDFNSRVGTDPYNVIVSGDMVNSVYEITTGITPAKIDHIIISENNVRASDSTFEYLPVIDAENEIPSDHVGLYTKMLGLVKSRIGGIAGSNSGTIINCIGDGTVSGSYNYGTLTGRNLGAVVNSHYTPQTNVASLGNSVDIMAPTQMTEDGVTAYALNQSVNTQRFTVTSGVLDLVSAGEDPACIGSDGTVATDHTYGSAVTVAPTCTGAGYTGKTCSVCGYLKKTAETAAAGHTFGETASAGELYHSKTCLVCGEAEYASHSYTSAYAAAGCGTYGQTVYTCSCGYSYGDGIDDDCKSHIWGSYAEKDASVHQQACTRDASHLLETAHRFSETPVEATCEEPGGITTTCGDCGYNFFTAIGTALGHTYGDWAPLDELQHQAVCTRDETHLVQADHVMTAGETTAPTCEEQGYTTYTCTECSYGEERNHTPALGHTFTYDGEAKDYLCHCGSAYVPDGDANGDGVVDVADIVAVLRRVDDTDNAAPDYVADVDKDGIVDLYDAILFVRQFVNS